MDRILLRSETTKFRNDAQCLKREKKGSVCRKIHSLAAHLVTLNIRRSRKERRTETPNDSSGLKCVQITSKIEPTIT